MHFVGPKAGHAPGAEEGEENSPEEEEEEEAPTGGVIVRELTQYQRGGGFLRDDDDGNDNDHTVRPLPRTPSRPAPLCHDEVTPPECKAPPGFVFWSNFNDLRWAKSWFFSGENSKVSKIFCGASRRYLIKIHRIRNEIVFLVCIYCIIVFIYFRRFV